MLSTILAASPCLPNTVALPYDFKTLAPSFRFGLTVVFICPVTDPPPERLSIGVIYIDVLMTCNGCRIAEAKKPTAVPLTNLMTECYVIDSSLPMVFIDDDPTALPCFLAGVCSPSSYFMA